MEKICHNLIVITGPTATGKTAVAVRLASEIEGEVISADSRQVYRGMTLGTGKDLSEYYVNGRAVPYHLIDIVDACHEFNVYEYQKLFYECFSDILKRGKVPVMVGGTGLYIDAVVRGYRMAAVPENRMLREKLKNAGMCELEVHLRGLNPELHNTTDLTSRKRIIRAIEIEEFALENGLPDRSNSPKIIPFVIGISCSRQIIRERIKKRLLDRIEDGMIEEVKELHNSGLSWDKMEYFGLEYRYVSRYLRGLMEYDDMVETLAVKINQFSKRQMTWFRRMERLGIKIHWVEQGDYDSIRILLADSGIYRPRGGR